LEGNPLEDLTLITIIAIAGGLIAGGLVKGVTGMGMPLVAVPIMTLFVPVPVAVSVMSLPIIASNLWQGWQGGQWRQVIRRVWPLLIVQPFGMVAGVAVLAWAEPRIVIGMLGALTILFVAMVHYQPGTVMSRRQERWVAPAMGLCSGFTGGVSSFFGTPIALYLFLLGLEKDEFVSAIGVTYAYSGTILLITLWAFGILGLEMTGWSLVAMPAAFAGMWLGQRLRRKLNADTFRTIVLVVLFIAGVNMLRRALMG
jgi:uncharacterized membrane protein YfcA